MPTREQPSGLSLWLLNLLALIEPLDQYIHQVKHVASLGSLEITEKMRLLHEASLRLSREMEGRFESLADDLQQRKRELEEMLNPPRPDLLEIIQELTMKLSEATEKMALRERFRRRWEDQSPAEILAAYEQGLAAGDEATIESFDVLFEDLLKVKGDDRALAAFRERRQKARETLLTPPQLRATQELQELQKLETSLRLIGLVVTTALKVGDPSTGGGPEPRI